MKGLIQIACTLLLCATTTLAHAMGLGTLNLHSHLNEPLHAEIDLLAIEDETILAHLKPTLASTEDYERAGLARPFYLTRLKFEVLRNDLAQPILKVSSTEAMREPVVQMLIALNGPNGKVIRQYTILLDVDMSLSPAQNETLENPRIAELVGSSTPNHVGVYRASIAKYAKDSLIQLAANEHYDPMSPDAPRNLAEFLPTIDFRPGGSYGPTDDKDTLWVIAERILPEDKSFTMPQAMVAIVNKNPQAFHNRNMNALKAGYVIRFPYEEEIRALTPIEAEDVIEAHHEAFHTQDKTQVTAPVEPETADPVVSEILLDKIQQLEAAVADLAEENDALQAEIENIPVVPAIVPKSDTVVPNTPPADSGMLMVAPDPLITPEIDEIDSIVPQVLPSDSPSSMAEAAPSTSTSIMVPQISLLTPAPTVPEEVVASTPPPPSVAVPPVPTLPIEVMTRTPEVPKAQQSAIPIFVILGLCTLAFVGAAIVLLRKQKPRQPGMAAKSNILTEAEALEDKAVRQKSSFSTAFQSIGNLFKKKTTTPAQRLPEDEALFEEELKKQPEEMSPAPVMAEPEIKTVSEPENGVTEEPEEVLETPTVPEDTVAIDAIAKPKVQFGDDQETTSTVQPKVTGQVYEAGSPTITVTPQNSLTETNTSSTLLDDAPLFESTPAPDTVSFDIQIDDEDIAEEAPATSDVAEETSDENDKPIAFDLSDTVVSHAESDSDQDVIDYSDIPVTSPEKPEPTPEKISENIISLSDEETMIADVGQQSVETADFNYLENDDKAMSAEMDLAKQYITLGDYESAKSMLTHIVNEASGPIKEKAQQMLKDLS